MKIMTGAAALLLTLGLASGASAANSPECGKYGMTCAPAAKSVQYTSGQKSPECGKFGMTCAPAGKDIAYTSGQKSPECGKFGMTCAPMPTAAAAAPMAGPATGRSAYEMRRHHHRRAMMHRRHHRRM